MESIVGILGYALLSIGVIGVSVYIALGSDFLKIGIAFLLQCLCLSGIFLILNQVYLAIFSLFVAFLGPVLVISLGSTIAENQSVSRPIIASDSKSKALRISGFCSGIVLGLVLSMCFLSLPLLKEGAQIGTNITETNSTGIALGQTLLGDQVVVFELVALMVLAFVIGTGILMRRSR